MKEADESKTKRLLARFRVPVTHLVQIETIVHRVERSSQETAHECHVILVNRLKLRDELSLISVNISIVLLVDKFGSLLINSELNNALELLSPNLLALDIQEVLDVFD